MTGLDPQNDVIVQAALIITDAELRPLEEFACDVWQPEEALSKMTPFVRHMHEKTGLLPRVQQSRIEIGMLERQLLERVAGWCTYPAVMCGNSIGQDKRFIERWMPGLAGFFSYRVLDVTSREALGAALVRRERGVSEARTGRTRRIGRHQKLDRRAGALSPHDLSAAANRA